MRALMTDDPGAPNKRYTISGNGGVPYGSFDTQEEVLEVVKSKPDGECTIRFGAGVLFDRTRGRRASEKAGGTLGAIVSVPLWAIVIPIGISGIALGVSVMTYLLAIKRDEEAREFAMIDRRIEVLLHLSKMDAELDALADHLPAASPAIVRMRASLKKIHGKVENWNIEKLATLDFRRHMDQIYTDLMVVSSETTAIREAARRHKENTASNRSGT